METDGLSHEEFMALSGLQPLPVLRETARLAILPVEYKAACQAIAACKDIIEARHWADKSDALAAWAKIYSEDAVGLEARRLKLYAYRRMGIIAGELRPKTGLGFGGGTAPGPRSLLIEQGFSNRNASVIRAVALMPQREFDSALKSRKPPTPTTLFDIGRRRNPEWAKLSRAMRSMRSLLKNYGPAATALSLLPDEAAVAKESADALIDWLEDFSAHIKSKRSARVA